MSVFCYTPPGLIVDLVHSAWSDPSCAEILHQASETSDVSLMVYLQYFLLTCCLEAPFYFLAIRSTSSPFDFRQFKRFMAAVILCNLATHPMVAFGIPSLVSIFNGTYGQSLTLGEIFAPVIESLLLIWVWKVPKIKAWSLSVLANLFSWWVGVYVAQSLIS